MGINEKLSKDENGVSIDPTLFRSMIGSLLYLIASRLDICFSVGVCARYQANPKESHLAAVKRIIRYVNGTADYGIWFSKDTNSDLAGYSDSNWVGNVDDRKSTTGDASILEIIWSLGIARNKTIFPYQLQRQNILLQGVVALNCYG